MKSGVKTFFSNLKDWFSMGFRQTKTGVTSVSHTITMSVLQRRPENTISLKTLSEDRPVSRPWTCPIGRSGLSMVPRPLPLPKTQRSEGEGHGYVVLSQCEGVGSVDTNRVFEVSVTLYCVEVRGDLFFTFLLGVLSYPG